LLDSPSILAFIIAEEDWLKIPKDNEDQKDYKNNFTRILSSLKKMVPIGRIFFNSNVLRKYS